MHATIEDLERAFVGNGHEFEAFIHDLIRAVGRSCGISAQEIEYDRRTSVPDGGRDIVVRVGNPMTQKRFIPGVPSLWSVKAGKEGIDPNQLKKEILPQAREDHPKVREALRNGSMYIWCAAHPASHDQRDKMREAAREVALELRVSDALIDFRWQDAVTDELNRFPNVISQHLPDVDSRWPGVRTLNEWQREPYLNNAWCDFGSRGALVTQIADHLLSSGLPNVLHIAGLSGIGKSRAALEACSSRDELHGVFYLSRAEELTPRLERSLQNAQRVYVVIDETPLEEIDAIAARFGGHGDQVRIVTIGPASRQRVVRGKDIVLVPEPEREEDVIAVLQSSAKGLSDTVLRSIAALSAHDLRLALMLVRASLRDPTLRTVPIVDFDGVWKRLMGLFRAEIPEPQIYYRSYAALTVAIDVGVEGEWRPELQCLAEYFQLAENDLLSCLNVAESCGLGLRMGRFFEVIPHALAIGLFRTLFRNQLRDRLPEFMELLPPRLLRRFLERCQECPDDVREEVAARVGDVFLGWLQTIGMQALALRETSRVFQAWAEFDPVRGLAWLRQAVEAANEEQLLGIDGKPDGSGGWRGRRQLVWLCQNLACFAEHFLACEAVLFRLAEYENEQFANNSTSVWRSLFWPVLSHTETPFLDRFPILLKRLQQATPSNLLLSLNGAFSCLLSNIVGMPLPPRVVGGRVVPPSWMPESNNQWHQLRLEAAGKVIEAIRKMQPVVRGLALRELVSQLRLFRELGLVDQVRDLYRPEMLDSDLRLSLVLELQHLIGFYRSVEKSQGRTMHAQVAPLEQWLTELTPSDLSTRVQDATARASYDLWGDGGPDNFLSSLAEEVIASHEIVGKMADWFESPRAKAVDHLVFAIGKRDSADQLAPQIRSWLRADMCRKVTLPYLQGASVRGQGLPELWAQELDTLGDTKPGLTVTATLLADVSSRGCDRVIRVLADLAPPAARLLREFGSNRWSDILTANLQQTVLEALLNLARNNDTEAPLVGMDLVRFWCHWNKSPLSANLFPSALELAAQAPAFARAEDEYNWHETLRLLCPHDPVRVAEIMLDVMTSPNSHPWRFGEDNVTVLIQAARLLPHGVMEVIGRYLLDRSRRSMFAVAVYHGLFDAVGVDTVRQWVNEHGGEHLRWIARHFPSPTTNALGIIEISPVTEWLFTEREEDQRAFEWFLMGRRSGARMWSGNQATAKRAEMQPYLAHPLRRVREWAADEIRFYTNEDELFQEFKDESDRI